MKLEPIFTHSPLRNFSYLIYAEDGSRVYCVDPWDSEQVATLLEPRGLKLTHIINTHEHGDHTRGNAGLVDRYNAQVLAHENAQGWISHLDCGLRGGEELPIENGCYFKVLDTPGHTFAHVSLLLHWHGQPYGIFSGDTFFNAGVGNCKAGGEPEQLYQTISKQYDEFLEDHIYIYPGHEYMGNNLRFTLLYEGNNSKALETQKEYERELQGNNYMVSTMGLERQINLFLRLDSVELQHELKKHFPKLHKDSSAKDIFLCLRQLRDIF